MKLSFRKALSANIFSSISGMATQAATAPVFLLAINVDQYAKWIFVASVSSYISLLLNGLFYALMNAAVIASHRGDRDSALRSYNLGMNWIIALWIIIAVPFIAYCTTGSGDFRDQISLQVLGVLFSIANLSTIMVDANFRSMHRYELGTNLLTIIRTLDWLVSVAAIFVFRDVARTLLTQLVYKVVSVGLTIVLMERRREAIKLRFTRFRMSDLFATFAMARGQLMLSFASSASTMGPQIIVSSIFDGLTAVMFNTYRTYFRLIAAIVTIVVGASWPIQSQMFAEKRIGEMRSLLAKLMVRSTIGATALGAVMLASAGPVFAVLFHGKVPVVHLYMAPILASVILNCGVSVQQSFYLATNVVSKNLAIGLAASLAGLAAMGLLGKAMGFLPALFGLSFFDLLALVAITIGTHFTLSFLRGSIGATGKAITAR
jgi:O-antigen/teichoic acid export membrane protein